MSPVGPASLAEFLQSVYVPSRLALAPNSAEQLAIAVRLLDRWLGRPATLADLDETTLTAWLRWLGDQRRSPRTINGKRGAILAIWRDAAERGLCRPPRKVPRAAEPKRLPVAWTLPEMAALWRACGDVPGVWNGCPAATAWRIAVAVIWDTACRFDSLWRAGLADVDLERGAWFVPAEHLKGRRADRLFRLHPDTITLVRQSVPPDRDRLFPYPRRRRQVWIDLKKILAAAGLPADRRRMFHCLRRTSESHAAAEKGVAWAADAVGHSEAVARQHYIAPAVFCGESLCDVLPRIDGGR